MLDAFSRTSLLLGNEAMNILKKKTVAIFGVGGVGGYALEALARTGIGHFVLVDNDVISLTNINRQILALSSNIGKSKVEIAKERVLSINPEAIVEIYQTFYLPSNRDEFDFRQYDYVVDAIDTVTAKIDIIVRCYENNIPIISSMGTGNKVHPEMLMITDLYKTEMDPLAKVMRHELKKRNIKKLKVVYSKEKPLPLQQDVIQEEKSSGRPAPGSVAFVPSVAGLYIASEVIQDLIKNSKEGRE